MSKDTSKLEEIRKALGLDSYGAKCTGLDCSHEIGVDHYIITDVHLADLLAWHREECLRIIGDDADVINFRAMGGSQHEQQLNYTATKATNQLRAEQRAKLRASLEDK